MRRIAVLAVVVCGAIAVGSSLAANPSSLRLVRVVGGLERPIYATQAPGEPRRLYVVEQPGRIRVVENGRLRAAPFLNLVSQVESGGNEQGLLGLAFSPGYARDGTFYVNYSLRGEGDTIVARYRARNGRVVAGTGRTILRVDQPYSNHNGGNLAFAPDGRLWVGLGDGGSGGDPENRAQSMDTLLGKMIRLDVRRAQPQPEIVALGLRNPWRYSFDRATGVLWIGDVGQNNLEEIDRLARPGTGLVNFGWDVYEGNARFEDKDLGAGRLVQPVAQYGRGAGCSVTGGYVYRGPAIPRISGRYLFGDYCSGTIWSMPAAGGAMRLESVRLPGLSSFGEGLRGELYAVSHEGAVYRFAR
ncbi:MAG TPA: PQQ-dependent sugar dehydrogenase [Gaiella sp.]